MIGYGLLVRAHTLLFIRDRQLHEYTPMSKRRDGRALSAELCVTTQLARQTWEKRKFIGDFTEAN